MHDYQKRSSSPNLAALQAYQRKLAAGKPSSRFVSPIPTNNPEPTHLSGKKRLLPSQMLEAQMMQRMQQANAVDSTDGEQEVQGKGDWQQKADLNAIFSNGSTLSSGLMAKYENLMPGVSLGQVSLHQGSQVDAALQTAGLHGLTDGTNVAVASTAPSGTLEHELGHVGQRQEQGFSLDEGNRQAHEKDADEIAGKLLSDRPVERFEQTASAKKPLLPSQMLEARMMQRMHAKYADCDTTDAVAQAEKIQQKAFNHVARVNQTPNTLEDEGHNKSAKPGNETVESSNIDSTSKTKAVKPISNPIQSPQNTNITDGELIAYGTRKEQTFDGGSARLNCFGEINRKMVAVWRLTSDNNQDDALIEANLNFRFSNNETKTASVTTTRPSQVLRGRQEAEFTILNGLTPLTPLTGERYGSVIMNGTARSNSHQKVIPDIEARCELFNGNILPESAKEVIKQASVEGKLYTYSLNPDHPDGGPKSRVFKAALGFTRENMDELARQLVFDSNSAIPIGRNEQGQLYRQIISVRGANGRTANVKTGWILRNDDGTIRLTTAVVESN